MHLSHHPFTWLIAMVVSASPLQARDEGARVPDSGTEALIARDADYRLAPRDQVVFEMFNEPDLKTTQRLTSRGELTLPLIGTVPITGMSLREAETLLSRLYQERGYFVRPQVMLAIAAYGERFVSVFGQVGKPSRVPLPSETNSIGVLEVIAQAGGFTRIARTDSVQVTRRTPGGDDQTIVVDVRAMLASTGRDRHPEFQLLPDDVVFVPERVF